MAKPSGPNNIIVSETSVSPLIEDQIYVKYVMLLMKKYWPMTEYMILGLI